MSAAALRNLWRRMPDRTTLTYRAQTALGTYAAGTAVGNCWWRPGGGVAEGGASAGVYVANRRTWFIPKPVLAGRPNVGDLIASGVTAIDPTAATYTVLGTTDVGALGCWSCESISLELQAGLRGAVTVARPDNARDAAGRMALTTYATVAAAVPARVQPADSAAGDHFDRRVTPGHYTAYLAYYVAVRAKDRVTDQAGVAYTVKAYRHPASLDSLFEVDLERIG